jgi:hypothetical protein
MHGFLNVRMPHDFHFIFVFFQAKIARLTKRFGAAKEDLKKRQEVSISIFAQLIFSSCGNLRKC